MSEEHQLPPNNYGSLWFAVIKDPSVYAILFSATFLVWYGSERAAQAYKAAKQNQATAEMIQTLSRREVILFPVMASISLLVLFYFFEYLQTIIIGMQTIFAASAFGFFIHPLLTFVLEKFIRNSSRNFQGSQLSIASIVNGIITLTVVLTWMYNGHWALNDALGFGLCVFALTFIQVPSCKVIGILFLGLLVYDVFWVFYSERFFTQNVMVSVATKEAANPMVSIAKALHIPKVAEKSIQKLELPVKLIFPTEWSARKFSMLGLGDIVIPGLFTGLLKRIDDSGLFSGKYFTSAIWGYVVGLLFAVAASRVFRLAQPALLYLLPCTILAVLFKSMQRRETKRLVLYDEEEERKQLPKP